MWIADAVGTATQGNDGGDSNVVAVVISGVISIIVVVLGQYFTGRNKKKVDATEVTEAGINILPEMSERVLDTLRRVDELTQAVGLAKREAMEARQEAGEAKQEAAAAKVDAASARRELSQAQITINRLKQERDQARVERDDFRLRLRNAQQGS